MFHRTRLNIRPDTWGKYTNVRSPDDTEVKAGENLFWRGMRFVFYPGLKQLNFRAGVWHSILTLFIIIFWANKDPPFKLEFNKLWAKQTVFPAFFVSGRSDRTRENVHVENPSFSSFNTLPGICCMNATVL